MATIGIVRQRGLVVRRFVRGLTTQRLSKKFENGSILTFEVNKLALLADGAAYVDNGSSSILVTAVASKFLQEKHSDFRLMVDYLERGSAIGRIPTTFNRREHGQNYRELIASRLIERAIRPLFPPSFMGETDVCAMLLSGVSNLGRLTSTPISGQIQTSFLPDAEVLAVNGASLALALSDIPWQGPVGAVSVATTPKGFVLQPSAQQWEQASIRLIYVGTRECSVVIDVDAEEASTETVLEAIQFAHSAIPAIIDLQEELVRQAGRHKRLLTLPPSETMLFRARDYGFKSAYEILSDHTLKTITRSEALDAIRSSIRKKLKQTFPAFVDHFAMNIVAQQIVREALLADSQTSGTRCDGRKFHQRRPMEIIASYLSSSVHGSALINIGETQTLSSITIEPPLLDSNPTRSKRLLFHHNTPNFASNETSFRKRRADVFTTLHDYSGERAFSGMLPTNYAFALRLANDTLANDGNTWSSAVCATSIALMDAGVPIQRHVASISAQVFKTDDGYVTFVDPQAVEEEMSDASARIAATTHGVILFQLEATNELIPIQVLPQLLDTLWPASQETLSEMNVILPQPARISKPGAPVHDVIEIDPALRQGLIGAGGKVIRQIQETTGTTIITTEGSKDVQVYAANSESLKQARTAISAIAGIFVVGQSYDVKITKVVDYGLFVQVENMPPPDGFIHTRDLLTNIKNLKVGDTIKAVCIGGDSRTRKLFSEKTLQQLATTSSIGLDKEISSKNQK